MGWLAASTTEVPSCQRARTWFAFSPLYSLLQLAGGSRWNLNAQVKEPSDTEGAKLEPRALGFRPVAPRRARSWFEIVSLSETARVWPPDPGGGSQGSWPLPLQWSLSVLLPPRVQLLIEVELGTGRLEHWRKFLLWCWLSPLAMGGGDGCV